MFKVCPYFKAGKLLPWYVKDIKSDKKEKRKKKIQYQKLLPENYYM